MSDVTASSIVLIVLCLATLYIMTSRSFARAVRFDQRLLKPITNLPTSWRAFLTPLSAILRPRNLGLLLAGIVAVEMYYGRSQHALFGALMITGMVGIEGLKLVFKRPRPANEHVRLHKIKSLSFPSGHAGGALLFCLAVAQLGGFSLATTLALLALGILVGFSRIYLQVHHPSDVIGGWILAVLWWQAVVLVLMLQ